MKKAKVIVTAVPMRYGEAISLKIKNARSSIDRTHVLLTAGIAVVASLISQFNQEDKESFMRDFTQTVLERTECHESFNDAVKTLEN